MWWPTLPRSLRPCSMQRARAVRQHSLLLMVEALEDRTVPSTFLVTSTADSGDGSLRRAVAAANATPGADTIVFSPNVQGTIELTSGELNVTDDVTIAGPGANNLRVSGDDASRVFS